MPSPGVISLNTNCLNPLNHLRRDRLVSVQHPPEIWPRNAQQFCQFGSTSHQTKKLSQLSKPSRVYRRDRLGFLAQLFRRPDQWEQGFVRYSHTFAKFPQGGSRYSRPGAQGAAGELALLLRLENERSKLGAILAGERMFERTCLPADICTRAVRSRQPSFWRRRSTNTLRGVSTSLQTSSVPS